ncbi:GreA/GreB family elongation factor [Motilimonas sp. E26]|uniref:GreA/GreB family elongation factor n=1 Tax=Motilimonas sp. E26 TaxID=2865674 RepID=UPI001E5BC249|nr:GreA/GreB family elongation factor [Motilimonas sp. E26]MCE0557389.1 GreA/GreB family elongation factor [Motilimonas sp. E26]
MNKAQLLTAILISLETSHQTAMAAAKRAHDTATDDENIAENKYDTLALEAAYLAQGQSVRVAQCAADVQNFKQLDSAINCSKVTVGALVSIIDEQGNQKTLFMGPSAGGLKVTVNGQEVVVITPSSPIGKELNQRQVGDEVSLTLAGKQVTYEVLDLS